MEVTDDEVHAVTAEQLQLIGRIMAEAARIGGSRLLDVIAHLKATMTPHGPVLHAPAEATLSPAPEAPRSRATTSEPSSALATDYLRGLAEASADRVLPGDAVSRARLLKVALGLHALKAQGELDLDPKALGKRLVDMDAGRRRALLAYFSAKRAGPSPWGASSKSREASKLPPATPVTPDVGDGEKERSSPMERRARWGRSMRSASRLRSERRST